MKKLITILFMSLFFWGFAQKFQLTDEQGEPYTNGQTISKVITENDLDKQGKYKITIYVNNLKDFEFNVYTLREDISFVDGMTLEVCAENCYTQEVYEFDFLLSEGGTMPFEIKLYPNDLLGLNKFKFDFWTEENKSDKITISVSIDMQPLGVKEQNNANLSLAAYPNPVVAGSNINVAYTLADMSNANKLVIRNILGAEVLSVPLSPYENNISVSTSLLVQGVYFYAIENKNRISIAKKLIVK